MDKLESIKLFVRATQLGSFTAVSEEKGVTQSAVSKKIAALEKSLGFPLLHRTSRQQHLTQSGAKYLRFAETLLQDMSEIESELFDEQSTPRGRLKITAPIAFGEHYLGGLIASFSTQYPDIQLELELSDSMSDMILNDVDIAIRANILPDSNFKARHLFDNQVTYVASPDYLARRGSPLHPKDLEHHDCLVYSLSSQYRHQWYFEEKGESISIPIQSNIQVNNASVLMQLALADQGVVALPYWMVSDELAAQKLQQVLKPFTHSVLPMYLLYKNTPYVPSRIRVFIDFLVEQMEAFSAR
ncbi:LysR family transcriptional regulator [Vibrio comitans]